MGGRRRDEGRKEKIIDGRVAGRQGHMEGSERIPNRLIMEVLPVFESPKTRT